MSHCWSFTSKGISLLRLLAVEARMVYIVVAACAACMSLEVIGQEVSTERELMQEVLNEVHDGDWNTALALITQEVEAAPEAGVPRRVRARVYERMHRYAEGVVDCSVAIERTPDDSELYHLRGTLRFKAGDFAGSVTDFDRQIALNPKAEQSHWQRGLSYYYTGEFAKGARQFEQYQKHDGGDVENVVWRMLCQARTEGWKPAQGAILPLDRRDRRVPMMQIYELFRGRATVDDVLAAAKVGGPEERILNLQKFYAHLYIGLYYEGLGKEAEAREHMFAAQQLENDHYMWNVADVHAERFRHGPPDKILIEEDATEGEPQQRAPGGGLPRPDPTTRIGSPSVRGLFAGGSFE